jgi:hypothetical protein
VNEVDNKYFMNFKKLLPSLFAKILGSVQDSPWWQEHLELLKEEQWNALVSDAAKHLPKEEKYKKLGDALYANQVRFIKDSHGIADAHKKMLLNASAKVINHLTPLTNIIGVQPMSGPTGLIFRLQSRTEEGKMSLEITRNPIAAKTRKLTARFNLGFEELQKNHALDFETELASAISHEAAMEIFVEMIHRLKKLAEKNEVMSVPTLPEGINFPAVMSDKSNALKITIREAANDIGRTTRRGCGNYIICSPVIVAMLQASNSKFESVSSENESLSSDMSTLMYVGMLDENIKVFTSISSSLGHNEILVGYQGNSDTDSGLIYSPYMPLMTAGVVTDPMTFDPSMTLMTRYDVDEPDGVHLYYRLIDASAALPL